MALGQFAVIAGDFRISNDHQFLANQLLMKKPKGWRAEKIPLDQVSSVEVASEEDTRTVGRTAGWGIAGALVAGPLGAVAGGILGGKKNTVTFICKLKDGRRFVGVMKKKQYQNLAAPFLLED